MDRNKKTTVLFPSAGTGGEQPLGNKTNQIITEIEMVDNQEATNNGMNRELREALGYLDTITLTGLYENVYQPKQAIVDNLLYSGTYFFAGAPKVGKSFFVAQLGYHVSKGIPLWDYPVHQGTVLYLALEDDNSR